MQRFGRSCWGSGGYTFRPRYMHSWFSDKYKQGDQVHGFRVSEICAIPDFHLNAIKLEHESTGMKYLHLEKDDRYNVFCITFETLPEDDTGVAHILEHLVLCGSQRYPVRDPFFKMSNRSLACYMNAFTSSDHTSYPFATTNAQDFKNLLSIYLDAVFRPLLREQDFRQEGWRLEHELTIDTSTPIKFKGVVFNEMKGYLADPSNLFGLRLQQKLMEGSVYERSSGGDPYSIVKLRHEDLVSFHQNYYHPSNAYIYSYGNMPLEDHLQYLSNQYLNLYEKRIYDTNVSRKQILKWKVPRKVKEFCLPSPGIQDLEKQTKMSVAFVTNDTKDIRTSFAMGIASSLLVGGPSSVFYKKLIDAKLGSDFSPYSGYDTHGWAATFAVGLQGMSFADTNQVENIVMNELRTLVRQGFDRDKIEATLHQLEIAQKHQSATFGMKISDSVINTWIQGGDPLATLRLRERIHDFRNDADSGVLNQLIERLLVQNNHRIVFIMDPDTNYAQEQLQTEMKFLSLQTSQLSSTEVENLTLENQSLLDAQNSTTDKSILPILKLDEVANKGETTKWILTGQNAVPYYWFEQETNGVTYFRFILSTVNIPPDLRVWIPIFSSCLGFLATETLNFEALSKKLESTVGDLSFSPFIATSVYDNRDYEDGLFCNMFCLDRNILKALELFNDICQRTCFNDKERVETAFLMALSSMSNSLVDSGHAFAMRRASSLLLPSSWLSELYSGTSQLKFLEETASSSQKVWLELAVEKMQQIHDLIFSQPCLRVSVTGTRESLDLSKTYLESIFKNWSTVPMRTKMEDLKTISSQHRAKIFLPYPIPVNYLAKSYTCVPYNHHDSAYLSLASEILSKNYLHRELREKGGAYGGGASFSALDGVMSFYSYRDPNFLRTVESFEKASRYFSQGSNLGLISEEDLQEAKLAQFARIDEPISPSSKGQNVFKYGISDELRQRRREIILSATLDNLRLAAETHLSDESLNFAIVALGNPPEELPNDWNL